MVGKRRVRGTPLPLIVEDHPKEYKGYPFITLMQYRDLHTLLIIDNATDKNIEGFVLDLCGPESVNEELVIETTADWFNSHRDRFPVSFYFSQMGVSEEFSKIFRTYPVDFVTRIIGPMPKFDMESGSSIKRRRKKHLPSNIKLIRK